MTLSGIEHATFRPPCALYVYIVTQVKNPEIWNTLCGTFCITFHMYFYLSYMLQCMTSPQAIRAVLLDENIFPDLQFSSYNVSSKMTSFVEYLIELNGGLLAREQ